MDIQYCTDIQHHSGNENDSHLLLTMQSVVATQLDFGGEGLGFAVYFCVGS